MLDAERRKRSFQISDAREDRLRAPFAALAH
jgi:hypothetical protein